MVWSLGGQPYIIRFNPCRFLPATEDPIDSTSHRDIYTNSSELSEEMSRRSAGYVSSSSHAHATNSWIVSYSGPGSRPPTPSSSLRAAMGGLNMCVTLVSFMNAMMADIHRNAQLIGCHAPGGLKPIISLCVRCTQITLT